MSCPSSNRDRFSRYCLSDFLNLLCVIEDEDNWLSGGNLTHERIPAGFLGSLKSCTSFCCLTFLDYAHCAPCREKLDPRSALEKWNDWNSCAVRSDSQCQIIFRTMLELLLPARAGDCNVKNEPNEPFKVHFVVPWSARGLGAE